MSRWWLGLGGNVGTVAATFAQAAEVLEASGKIVVHRRSRLYRSAPMGAQAGAVFTNAVLEIETALSPLELLDICQSAEAEAGRTRTVVWGPRPLDIDLLLCDAGVVVDVPRLAVPHPHLWYRRFVLDPLVELAGEVVHPQLQRSIRALHDHFRQSQVTVGLFAPDADRLVDHLQRRQSSPLLVTWVPGERPPTLLLWDTAATVDAGVAELQLPWSRLAWPAIGDRAQFVIDVLAALEPPIAE